MGFTGDTHALLPLNTHGNYLHVNDFQGRKVVLSQPLLENAKITALKVVAPDNIINRFLNEVRVKPIKAVRQDKPLL